MKLQKNRDFWDFLYFAVVCEREFESGVVKSLFVVVLFAGLRNEFCVVSLIESWLVLVLYVELKFDISSSSSRTLEQEQQNLD